RGFIWYQGESNRGEGMLYRDKMEALIRGWRTRWEDDALACYFVQLAPYNYGNTPTALPEIWEAQTAVLDIPHTGMAVINDIGNVKDIHPRNKDDVGRRLALLALNKTYGKKNIVCDSPLYDHFEVEGAALRVYFKHAATLKTRDGAAPDWFYISGIDGVYREANAVIEGTTVVLTVKEISDPAAVRFAWDHCAEPNLMNEAGLPAAAFRAGTIPVDGLLRSLVPESEGMQMVYAFDPTNSIAAEGRTVYTLDNSEALSGKKIERIAYFLHLVTLKDEVRWIYVEIDPFTRNLQHIGVPLPQKGAQFQQDVANMILKSNVKNLPTGKLSGAIEAWACNYG
ncbi:MAG: 9-O-acetylesterase, partial [Candidatus Hydrogenedentes bacterium]|nr:9-O-acetylesterase [Candidatus Hydrogenedentota bacterium]